MHSEIVHQAIGNAAQKVLETMYFTLLATDGLADGDANEIDQLKYGSTAESLLRAAMTFSGAWSGSFYLEIAPPAAREIMINFTGDTDPTNLTDQALREALSELANMVCGSTLSFLDENKLFDLSTPQVTTRTGNAGDANAGTGELAPVSASDSARCAAPAALQIERAFLLDSGASIRFAIASEAFR